MIITYLLPVALITILTVIQIPSFRPAVAFGMLIALFFLGFKAEAPSSKPPSSNSFIEVLFSPASGK